jgi:hypothetical protein
LCAKKSFGLAFVVHFLCFVSLGKQRNEDKTYICPSYKKANSMAQHELIMPKMGESVAEATIIKWVKSEGDKIKIDETVLEIATDKVDSEIPWVRLLRLSHQMRMLRQVRLKHRLLLHRLQ